jgi:beta-glucosidase/6-phospho-beta-glucosidase/beta-galactosidase
MSAPALSRGASTLFPSFWLGGFECACHINRARRRVDMLALTQHDVNAAKDYKLLRELGMLAARDGVRWPLIDHGGQYDFESLAPMIAAAESAGMQIIWDLCHWGWPDGLDIFTAEFVNRFARYAGVVAAYIRDHSSGPAFYTPVNEPSWFCWAIGKKVLYPFTANRDDEIKRQLVRAVIAGVEAIWRVDPKAHIIHQDPVMNVIARDNAANSRHHAEIAHEAQFQSWDMISGRMSPELGGSPQLLDVLGLSYYYDNQVIRGVGRLRWEDSPRDPRWKPFHQIAADVYHRYGRPLYVGETSHFGPDRGRWIQEIASEVRLARNEGIPVEGICVYPILDRPDWDNFGHWHHSGLWDLVPNGDGRLKRVLNESYAADLALADRHLTSSA